MSAAGRDEGAAQLAVEGKVGDESDEMNENLRRDARADGDENREDGDDDRPLIDNLVLGGRSQAVGRGRVRLLDEIG